jgi:valyl-tRNA synthetase
VGELSFSEIVDKNLREWMLKIRAFWCIAASFGGAAVIPAWYCADCGRNDRRAGTTPDPPQCGAAAAKKKKKKKLDRTRRADT